MDDFDNITVREIGTRTKQPFCIMAEGNVSVAVFEWKSDGFVGLRPVSVSKIFITSSTQDSIQGYIAKSS